MEDLKYIIFKLGDNRYGIFLQCIKGIEEDYKIVPVPNAPDFLKGIINLRGEVIPVYSLRAKFNMEYKNEGSLLIANTNSGLLAFEVDAVMGIEEMHADDIKRMPKMLVNEETEYMEEVLKIDKDIVIAITIDELLSSEEDQAIQNMVDKMSKDNK